ncbi:hypothetical protein Q8F55_006198 [Vanrija albida]|uniref:Uncharacterized protein n=1 Tax=Vanrija albida TaxID=181172 RepID=A0ABR3PXA2_9TREE
MWENAVAEIQEAVRNGLAEFWIDRDFGTTEQYVFRTFLIHYLKMRHITYEAHYLCEMVRNPPAPPRAILLRTTEPLQPMYIQGIADKIAITARCRWVVGRYAELADPSVMVKTWPSLPPPKEGWDRLSDRGSDDEGGEAGSRENGSETTTDAATTPPEDDTPPEGDTPPTPPTKEELDVAYFRAAGNLPMYFRSLTVIPHGHAAPDPVTVQAGVGPLIAIPVAERSTKWYDVLDCSLRRSFNF